MEKYLYVRAWHALTGSYAYYIANQIDEARRDNAPARATYKRDGKWQTIDDCSPASDMPARCAAWIELHGGNFK